jgi:hypothetical protein
MFSRLAIEIVSLDEYLRGSNSYAVTRRDGIYLDCQVLPGDGFILYDKLPICGRQLAPSMLQESRTFCTSASEEEFLPWSQPEFLACMTLSNGNATVKGAVPLRASPSFSRTHISSSSDQGEEASRIKGWTWWGMLLKLELVEVGRADVSRLKWFTRDHMTEA